MIYYFRNMIKKVTLRKEVKKTLLDLMFKGEIKPGHRISLPTIANKLEVSVTPVREALTQLTESQVLTYIPNRGFFVTELKEKDFKDIYEIIITLESLAVANTVYTESHIQKLKKIQSSFIEAKNNIERLRHDLQFHDALIELYDNNLLKKIIDDTRIRIFFFELEYMKVNEKRPKSDHSHNKIINYLEKGKKQEAVEELSINWILSVKDILENYNNSKNNN